MRKFLVVVLALACVLTPVALAGGTTTSTTDRTPYTCDGKSARAHYKAATSTIDSGWNWRNWRQGPKQSQVRTVQDHLECLERAKDRSKIKGYLGEKAAALQSYREYRQLTPYRCQSGKYGTWAIPCSIIECESHFSWGAYNPSGASGPYQLLGWGAPMPANTWARKLEHHRIAAGLWSGGAGRSHWVC